MIGKTIGHYRIISQLGKGGMGEVYLAEDTTLNRKVALKFLPEAFTNNPERMARFEREAKLLASLNHPNIAGIYGLEQTDDTRFLALELVEGDTLADRLKRGPIPVEEALKLAMQIAEALEAAHEKGVIHRDFKPANIKVTPDGKVKVLDFGLAKALAGDQGEMNLADSPTISVAATQQGIILGTAAYMSPEQAKGKIVDKRADIWAFGAVFFEMLTGKPAFPGDDISEVLASVIKGDSNLDLLPKNTHSSVHEIIVRCLQKDLRQRYQDIGDVRIELEKILSDPAGVLMQPDTTLISRKTKQIRLLWVVAALLFGVIATGFIVWNLRTPASPRVIRFDYEIPEDHQLNRMGIGLVPLEVSPDGSQFAYSTTDGIYIRKMDKLYARLIPGSDKDAFSLCFSPDSRWLSYFSLGDHMLKRISITGGAPIDICTVPNLVGSYWCEDDTIVYSNQPVGIYRVSVYGGTPELLAEGLLTEPQLLNDEKSLLFVDLSGGSQKVVVQSLQTGEQTVVLENGFGQYLRTGHLVYGVNGNTFAVPFDLDTLEFTGEVVSIDEPGMFCSDSGTLAYMPDWLKGPRSDIEAQKRNLVWVYRDGREESLEADPNDFRQCKISPDGTQVALSMVLDGNQDLWIWDMARKRLNPLTFHQAVDDYPVWTHAGQSIVFRSERQGGRMGSIFLKKADGTGDTEHIYPDPGRWIGPWSWFDKESILLLSEISMTDLGGGIGILSTDGDKWTRSELLQGEYEELQPQISPDGRYVAYLSGKSGEEEIFVRPFPDVNKGRWKVSKYGGNSPLWSPDGKTLYYRNGDATIAVEVETEPKFSVGNTEILFRGPYFSIIISPFQITETPWDIHPDGDRFLMIKPLESKDEESANEAAVTDSRKIIIVTNWFEVLKRQAPASK